MPHQPSLLEDNWVVSAHDWLSCNASSGFPPPVPCFFCPFPALHALPAWPGCNNQRKGEVQPKGCLFLQGPKNRNAQANSQRQPAGPTQYIRLFRVALVLTTCITQESPFTLLLPVPGDQPRDGVHGRAAPSQLVWARCLFYPLHPLQAPSGHCLWAGAVGIDGLFSPSIHRNCSGCSVPIVIRGLPHAHLPSVPLQCSLFGAESVPLSGKFLDLPVSPLKLFLCLPAFLAFHV